MQGTAAGISVRCAEFVQMTIGSLTPEKTLQSSESPAELLGAIRATLNNSSLVGRTFNRRLKRATKKRKDLIVKDMKELQTVIRVAEHALQAKAKRDAEADDFEIEVRKEADEFGKEVLERLARDDNDGPVEVLWQDEQNPESVRAIMAEIQVLTQDISQLQIPQFDSEPRLRATIQRASGLMSAYAKEGDTWLSGNVLAGVVGAGGLAAAGVLAGILVASRRKRRTMIPNDADEHGSSSSGSSSDSDSDSDSN